MLKMENPHCTHRIVGRRASFVQGVAFSSFHALLIYTRAIQHTLNTQPPLRFSLKVLCSKGSSHEL